MLKISSVNPEEWKYPEPKYPLPKGFKYNTFAKCSVKKVTITETVSET